MDLNEYKQAYYNFEAAVNQTRLIALSAAEVLREFPRNLPVVPRMFLVRAFRELGRALLDAAGKAEEAQIKGIVGQESISLQDKEALEHPFAEPGFRLIMAERLLGEPQGQHRVERLAFAQELVMLLAHLDAFMADSLRAMCRREPRLLRRNKKMNWDDILEGGSWDKVIDRMIEEYIYEFGWKSIRERIQFLQSEHGVIVNIPPEELEVIDEAENIRHIVIHNGGRVSQEYLHRTKRTDIKREDVIPVDDRYTAKISSNVTTLGGELFFAIATKYFQAKDDDLTSIWRRASQHNNTSFPE